MFTTARIEPGTVASRAAAGRGAVAIACRAGRSVVTRAYAISPLRLLNPANHGGGAWVYMSSLGGGLVDGDGITLEVDVGPGATGYLATQSATKVYRSPSGTTVDTHCIVGSQGLLVVAPDPVMPFAGARYRQRQRFDIAADAGLVVIDSLVSGRHASGERWRFLEYRSLIEVRVDGRLRVYDPVSLRAVDGDLTQRFDRFNVLAAAIVAGGSLRTEITRVLALAAQRPMGRRSDPVVAASPVGDDACILRLAGTAAEGVGRTLRELLRFVPVRLADDPWIRKW